MSEEEVKKAYKQVFKQAWMSEISAWANTQTRIEVDCSKCKSVAGQDCRTPKGKITYTPHRERCDAYFDKIGQKEWERRHTRPFEIFNGFIVKGTRI